MQTQAMMRFTTRTGGAYHTALAALIVLILLTILFGVMAWSRYTDAEVTRFGNPEMPETMGRSLLKARDEQQDLETLISQHEAMIDAGLRVLADLDMELAGKRNYQDPYRRNWLVGGDASNTNWSRTRQTVAHTLSLMEQSKAAHDEGPDFSPLEDQTADFQEQLNQVYLGITEADERFADENDNLLTKLDDIRKAMETEDKAFKKTKSEISTQISRLEQEIRELLELRLDYLDEPMPDGKVLETDLDRRFVVVNIGAKDRVVNGLRLEIFQYVRGRWTKKGMCEVIDVEPLTAVCRVVEEVDGKRNPITRDDLVGNPCFDTKRSVVFVLDGEFQYYNRADYASFLRRIGAEVWDTLKPGVDFLVKGGEVSPLEDQARQYVMLGMTEEQLRYYLERTFTPEQ